jgi:diaminohydroxyphosphoribosylaminopyrimidine deaminase/5-amino-6-(5-phosphoribosylamino)uracil reductase
VAVGVKDPNPRVDGGGMAILQANGIEVREGVLGEACARFHAPFFKSVQTGLPWVMLKLALGADGAIGPEGVTTQVTSTEIQQLAHALRRASEAIVVGRWTVQVDNPLLTDRWPAPTAPHRQALRVVLDSHGRLPADRKVWQSVAGQPVLRAVVEDLAPLRDVEDLRLPPTPSGCSLRHLLHELAARGVGRVLFEGGGQLAQALLAQGLVDEFHRFTSEAPAGGEPVRLDTSTLPRTRANVAFRGGRWEVLSR